MEEINISLFSLIIYLTDTVDPKILLDGACQIHAQNKQSSKGSPNCSLR